MKKINEFTFIGLGVGFGLAKLVSGFYWDAIAGTVVIAGLAVIAYKIVKSWK